MLIEIDTLVIFTIPRIIIGPLTLWTFPGSSNSNDRGGRQSKGSFREIGCVNLTLRVRKMSKRASGRYLYSSIGVISSPLSKLAIALQILIDSQFLNKAQ